VHVVLPVHDWLQEVVRAGGTFLEFQIGCVRGLLMNQNGAAGEN